MLVLRRTEGQWVEVTHRSGDVLRFRVYDLGRRGTGRVQLAFADPDRNFAIERPERVVPGDAQTDGNELSRPGASPACAAPLPGAAIAG